ncbi:MAG: metallophosphoesterase, partial [Gemmatimonadales bacterium]
PVGWLMERLTAPLARWDAAALEVPEIPIPVRDLPGAFEGYRIALVTDLHRGPGVPAWWLMAVADRATDLAPDLIVLGGDFVSHSRRDLDDLPEILRRFRARDGVVAVLGNHDHWIGAAAVRWILEAAGVDELWNSARVLRRDGGGLAIAGVGDFTHDAILLDQALAGLEPQVPRVVVSHNPDLAGYLPPGLRVDVMLSGHTHGGHVRFPWFGPLTVPSQFGRRFLAGRVRVGETELVVSRGVGSAAVPRAWNPPELPIIRLTRSSGVRPRASAPPGGPAPSPAD